MKFDFFVRYFYVVFFVAFQSVFAAPFDIEKVLLKCGEPEQNNERLERAAERARTSKVLAVEKQGECDVLLHHAVAIHQDLNIKGPGLDKDEIPNSNFIRWSNGDRYVYGPPVYGDPKSYSGTGGHKIEHARCWVSNVWGLKGNGVVSRRYINGRSYINWLANSIEPPQNKCDGRRVKCIDDPDATGFQHINDIKARKLIRNGTAGHDLSQMINVDKFYNGWVTVRVRVRLNAGNNRFYVRLIQGYGRNGQMIKAVSHTLPGIILERHENNFVDYVLITNLRAQNERLQDIASLSSNHEKYAQIALTSSRPELAHNIDVLRISMHRGIVSPSNPVFGPADVLIGRRGNFCN